MNEWYYVLKGEQKGPVTLEELQGLATSGVIQPQDFVWKQGMANWEPYESVIKPAGAPVLPVKAGMGGVTPLETQSMNAAPAVKLPDNGPYLCWGIFAIAVPFLGGIIFIALIVLHILELMAVREAKKEGLIPSSQYANILPCFDGVRAFLLWDYFLSTVDALAE